MWKRPEFPPLLGLEYSEKLRGEALKWDELVEAIDGTLAHLSAEALAKNFWLTGQAQEEPFIRYQQAWMARAMEFFELDYLCLCGLGLPSLQPDYDHWANAATYSVDEITYLSIGIEPDFDLISKMTGPKVRCEPLWSAKRAITKRRDLISRELTKSDQTAHIDRTWLVNWHSQFDLDLLHPGFDAMASKVSKKMDNRETGGEVALKKDSPHKSEIESMAKLVTAIAIQEFGYDPTAERGPIPNEMVGIMDQLGLSLSPDTVRKYLKTGAKLLPKDWKPDR